MRYKILKSFKGSQDGRFSEDFEAGAEYELSDYLIGCVPSDWIESLDKKSIEIDNKAIITDSPKRKIK